MIERHTRRDVIEDLALLLTVTILSLVLGYRFHEVYGPETEVPKCAAEDELSFELLEPAYGYVRGTTACIRVDAVKFPSIEG